MNDIKLLLAKKLKHYRALAKHTQEKLAELAGLSSKHIQRLEGKKPSGVTLETLKKIADAFKVSLSKFLKGLWCFVKFYGGYLKKLKLKLYIAGKTATSSQAITELQQILKDEFGKNYDLQIIDILKHPEMAEQDKIIAAPTLLKYLPPPAQKIIGDLTHKEKVLLGLNIDIPLKTKKRKA